LSCNNSSEPKPLHFTSRRKQPCKLWEGHVARHLLRERHFTRLASHYYALPGVEVANISTQEYESTPESKSNFALPIILATPQHSPRLSTTEPSTPPIAEQPAINVWGLLTPGTPNICNSIICSPITNNKEREGDPGVHTAITALLDDENKAIEVADGANANGINGSSRLQDHEDGTGIVDHKQHQESRNDVDEGDNIDDDEPIQTRFDEMEQHIKDAQIAIQLGQDLDIAGKRRSRRLAKKNVAKGEFAPLLCINDILTNFISRNSACCRTG
jgi:hypothetical protein